MDRHEIVPDPEQPERWAIDGEGQLLGGVRIAPVGADPLDRESWTHIGWSRGILALSEEAEDAVSDPTAAIAEAEAEALAQHQRGECHLSEWSCSFCEAES